MSRLNKTVYTFLADLFIIGIPLLTNIYDTIRYENGRSISRKKQCRIKECESV